MSDVSAIFAVLRESAGAKAAEALEQLVLRGADHELNRINTYDFAANYGLAENEAIAVLLHATRLGAFDLSWNVLCPGCGCVLNANASLKTIRQEEYSCSLCAAGFEPTLDELVEVTFTVNPRIRRIAAHNPDELSYEHYFRQIFWGSGFAIPECGFARLVEDVCLDYVELPPGERAILSLQLPRGFVVLFEPVTHTAQFLDVQGEPATERQKLSIVFNEILATHATVTMQPGPVRITLENRTSRRTLPGVWVEGEKLHDLLGHRKPFLTAKRLLTNHTFRDMFRTASLDVDQRLKITSLTFLFTDLKGSTQLYDRVGDLVAFDLVRAHFDILIGIVASEAGAVVKTIGDAVMATFPTPAKALSAALQMREAMETLGGEHGDFILKIGIHEGPCLAVALNDQQDFFGHSVNVAARVQGLATSRRIIVSNRVFEDSDARELVEKKGLQVSSQVCSLSGVTSALEVYEIS